MPDTNTLSHTTWSCKYHIVFAPKYRRKVYLKGKSSIMIYNKWGNMKFKYRNRQFWCRGYYVDTAGKNAKKIQEYIKHQLDEDRSLDQLTFDLNDPFNG